MPLIVPLFLSACPAEDLGVVLPPSGAAAISPEDLERDHWTLGKEEPGAFFAERMRQMNVAEVLSGPSWACGLLQAHPARRLDAPWPSGADLAAGQVGAAILISLAKSWDGEAGPPIAFCMRAGPEALPADLRDLPAVMVDPGPLRVPPDFRVLADRTREIRRTL